MNPMVEYGESGGASAALIFLALVAIGHLVVGLWACGACLVRWIGEKLEKPAPVAEFDEEEYQRLLKEPSRSVDEEKRESTDRWIRKVSERAAREAL